jgi:TIR domain-containing protein
MLLLFSRPTMAQQFAKIYAAIRALYRRLIQIWYLLFRNDVFISYTRSDAGRNYAHALATELQQRELDVLMDTFEARSSPETPEALLDQMRCCMQMVIVASPSAVTSTEVAKEVRLFPKKGRSIVLLEFSDNVRTAQWYQEYLRGLPPVPAQEGRWGQSPTTLQAVKSDGTPLAKPNGETVDLMKWEFPRLCRGGSQTLRIPGVYLPLLPSFLPKPVASRASCRCSCFSPVAIRPL